ncbi:MAG TPA: patatin [Bacteroidetes bacterium]|nr:patatin [Bacteroidota bacterium]HIL57678.1 patatin [Rhodothermales bacterium]
MLNALTRLLGIVPSETEPVPSGGGGGLAVVLTGGGARAAYQAGVLRGLSSMFPEHRPRILTGVSAGGLNASFLANHSDAPYREATDTLVKTWRDLRADHVFEMEGPGMLGSLVRFFRKTEEIEPPRRGGVLDTTPLHRFVERHLGPLGQPIDGIARAVESGDLHAFALTTTSYTTGQSVTWVQGEGIEPWDRPMRRAVRTQIRPEHVLASAALPFFFPAVAIDDEQVGHGWYGDGGIRLTAPLSPALHLGADKVLVITTRYARTPDEADTPDVLEYPPPAQVLGVLMSAVFLDVIDRDAQTLTRINELIRALPPEEMNGFRPVDLLVMRPSEDVGQLAGGIEPRLPPRMQTLVNSLGGGETKSPDWLSMLMFDEGYVNRLIAIGEADVYARRQEIEAFLGIGEEEAEPE